MPIRNIEQTHQQFAAYCETHPRWMCFTLHLMRNSLNSITNVLTTINAHTVYENTY